MNPLERSNQDAFRQACHTDQLVDNWILSADAERRFHYRPDERSIDELLEVMVTNSFLFGDFDEDDDEPKTDLK